MQVSLTGDVLGSVTTRIPTYVQVKETWNLNEESDWITVSYLEAVSAVASVSPIVP